jgi:hypothetical protein
MPQVDDLAVLPQGRSWLVVECGVGITEETEEQARQTMKAL